MPVFVRHRHLLYDLFDVLISSFNSAVHHRPVGRRVMMLDLELCVELSDHGIVKVGSIISDDPLRDTIPEDKVVLDDPGYEVLGN